MMTSLLKRLTAPLVTTLLLLGLSIAAQAKVFRNAYVSFELPEKWDCQLEQTEFVCRSQDPTIDNREAIIVLTAKEVGPADNLAAYQMHLKTQRTIANRAGQPMQSQVYKIESRNISTHPWIDGMHLASEIPNYYTRYLATTKDKIGILVTFSAHKLHFTKYSSDFFRAIESLRVTASKAILSGQGGGGGVIPGSEIMGANFQGGLMEGEAMPEEGSGSGTGSSATTIMGIALILAAIGAYLLIKRRKS